MPENNIELAGNTNIKTSQVDKSVDTPADFTSPEVLYNNPSRRRNSIGTTRKNPRRRRKISNGSWRSFRRSGDLSSSDGSHCCLARYCDHRCRLLAQCRDRQPDAHHAGADHDHGIRQHLPAGNAFLHALRLPDGPLRHCQAPDRCRGSDRR